MTISSNSISPIRQISPANNAQLGNTSGGVAASTSSGQVLYDKLWTFFIKRNGNPTLETLRMDFGASPAIHHILDPATVASQFTLFFEDMIESDTAVGTCTVFCGFISYITAGDPTTLMGVGFYADSTDNLWHCFIFDSATGAVPISSIRDTATTILTTSMHRMKIKIDGPTKTISWFIDGALVDSYVPVASLRYLNIPAATTGTSIVIGAFVPANATCTIRHLPGSIPLLRLMSTSTPVLVPISVGGASMHVSVIG